MDEDGRTNKRTDLNSKSEVLKTPGQVALTLHEKCPYSEFFWSVFSHNRTEFEYLSVLSPNVEKYGPEELRIRTLLTPCYFKPIF